MLTSLYVSGLESQSHLRATLMLFASEGELW
jgi:hypothetical protein